MIKHNYQILLKYRDDDRELKHSRVTRQELIDKSIDCFNAINPKLGHLLAIMKANNLFDVESRKGKAPG
ncbi:MAG: hypothetical protein EOO43_18685, partial [Flavobacterium sp.]